VIRNLDHHVNGQRFGPSNINDQKIGWEFSKKKKWLREVNSPYILSTNSSIEFNHY
jgi:hypothetical protein